MWSDQPKRPAVAIIRQNDLSSASSRASVAVTILAVFDQKVGELGPVTRKLQPRMLTYFQSTVCILRMLIALEFEPRDFATRGALFP